jgi:hypothetical protein
MNQAEPQAGQLQQYPQPGGAPPPQQDMRGLKMVLIVSGVIFVVLFLLGTVIGVLLVTTIPKKLVEAEEKAELEQLKELDHQLGRMTDDLGRLERLRGESMESPKGGEFWALAFDKTILDQSFGQKLASPCGSDTPWGRAPMPRTAISYTAPQADELYRVMKLRGAERCVVITWNARNWRNLAGDKVPVVWQDKVEFMTFEQANDDWAITPAEWGDPAGKLFGKKAPFQHTYE